MNTKGICQTIDNIGSNPTNTQQLCNYGFTGGTGISFKYWELPSNCVPFNSNGQPDYNKINSISLPIKWKNTELSSFPSTLKVYYLDSGNIGHWVSKSFGPFTLTLPTPSFSGGSTKNIPCHNTGAYTITLNSYKNTSDNGLDKDSIITRHFEWTLPSGWQTTSFQFGTFVGSSSISVIPLASTTSTSISVRAKANTQYSHQQPYK